MKRKRGRPREKSFPEPHTTSEGFDIAIYGKVGGSEAMAVIRDCPYPTIDWFERKKKVGDLDKVDRQYLELAPKFAEQWAIRIGPLLGKKIVEGDANFFFELAKAVEEYSKDPHPIQDFRRYLAIRHRFLCNIRGQPFTLKGLREYYRTHHPHPEVNSSTLSRMFRWAKSAHW